MVYDDYGAIGFGKIMYYLNSLPWAKSTEHPREDPRPINQKIRTFDSPLKAIAYFLVHQNKLYEQLYTKKEAIMLFLSRFPSQRKCLEKYIQRPVSLEFEKSTLEEIDMPHL